MSKPLAIILHNRLSAVPAPDEADVLNQVSLVQDALTQLGYQCRIKDTGFQLYGDITAIQKLRPAFVFNLVETVFGKSELLHIAPSILKALHVPYSGVSDEALFLTTRKTLAKQLMQQNRIATPAWFSSSGAGISLVPSKKYIIKPIAEEGSVCLDENAVFTGSALAQEAVQSKINTGNYFVEEFIEGREFNLSVTGCPNDYTVFPVAEMQFTGFPRGKEHVLGYRAKWEEASFEYQHTCRKFETLADEPQLHRQLVETACRCGEIFQLSGYFRVDFRVTDNKQPFVLEINGNPCIAPDSGFIAAATHDGISSCEVVQQIIQHLN